MNKIATFALGCFWEAEQTKQSLIAKGVGVVTEIVPAQVFYPAEDYHQKYLLHR